MASKFRISSIPSIQTMIGCSRSYSTYYEYMVSKFQTDKEIFESKINTPPPHPKNDDFVAFWRLPKKDMLNAVTPPNTTFTGLNLQLPEYNRLIESYIQIAEDAVSEYEALEKLHQAYLIYGHIRDQRLEIDEETYTPIYMFLRNKKEMVEQLTFFRDKVMKDNPGSHSHFLFIEATATPHIEIEEKIAYYKHLLDESKIAPSSKSVDKLMKMCYDESKVNLAIDFLEYTISKGLTVKLSTVKDILQSCHITCEYHLVYRILSLINDHKIGPDHETFRIMISLYVNLKNFRGALDMMNKMRDFGVVPKTSIYNTIMVGFFKEKRFSEGLKLLAEMDASNVKPDSYTYSYLIGHCNQESDVRKYHKKFNESGVKPTKHIFTALINAYAACGMFEKAKQILSDKEIPEENLDEIKNTVVSVLAIYGQITDALNLYDELIHPDPKVSFFISRHLDLKNELGRLLRILKHLEDSEHWLNVCGNVVLYCFRHELLSDGLDLLKNFMEKSGKRWIHSKLLIQEIFAQVNDAKFGLDLLRSIKGNNLIHPSRKCHDFVIGTCFEAKDIQGCYRVWEEYRKSGLHYNSLSYFGCMRC